jgi:multiple sugar transport system substrate-binding protein
MSRRGRVVSRRRALAGGVAVVALAGLPAVAACGTGGGAGDAGAGGPGGATASGSITFMSRDNGTDLEPYKQGIARFNASQSKISVTHEIAASAAGTNYFQKLQTMIVSGTPPDVSYMHSANAPTFAAEGALAPLDAYVRRDKGALDGLLPNAVDSYRWKEALVGVPDVATSLVMYVNRSLFERTGTPLPSPTWTWADYLTTAQRIANAGRADGSFGAVDYNGNFPRYTVLWQNDADLLNKDRSALTIDQPAAVEALTWIADQLHKSRVHPTAADMEGKNAQAFFLEGKAAMWPNISSSMGTVAKNAQFEVEIFHLPQGKKRITRTACGGTAALKASKNPEAGWAFERFLATEDFQWLMTRAAGIIFPAHKKVTESPDVFAGGPFPRSPRITVDAMAYARTEPYVPLYDDLVAAYNREIASVWTGESSVKDAVTRARAALEPILQDSLARGK